MTAMKKLVLKSMLVVSLAASAIGIGAGNASAETMTQEGCVEWNATGGCVVRQVCSLNTNTRTWHCVTYDTRDGSMTADGGSY
jgi:hypothetical protein